MALLGVKLRRAAFAEPSDPAEPAEALAKAGGGGGSRTRVPESPRTERLRV